jgi:hypothetical protein
MDTFNQVTTQVQGLGLMAELEKLELDELIIWLLACATG